MNSDATKTIAFQGELGAFSHQACREIFGDKEWLPCMSFEDALAAVRAKAADYAVMPIENSTYGRVADLHHLLPTSGLYIIAEHFLPVHLQLLGVPGAKLGDITHAQSHAVALGQCKKFMQSLGIQPVTGADTAGSAQQIAKAGDKTRAAIASRLAGEIYGLEVLAEDIEDMDHNTTRFLVMSRQRIEAEPDDDAVITSFVFEVKNVPAALYKAMGGFATTGINMVKLESYMTDGSFTATQFYAEIEGHSESQAALHAFEDLNHFTKYSKILGVYPQAPFRKAQSGAG